MLTRVLVVQPLFSVVLDETDNSLSKPVCGDGAPGTPGHPSYEANGQILQGLAAILQKLVAAMPTLLPEILQLISLFGTEAAPPANTAT